jgi:hypothetical protein
VQIPPCAENGIGPHGFDPLKQLFWGELHLHTQYSLDAFSFGTRTTPAEAYLFAKGQGDIHIGVGTNGPPGPVISNLRPLDFTAITDHSEFLSVISGCLHEDSGYYTEPACVAVRSQIPQIQAEIFPNQVNILKELCWDASDRPACLVQLRLAWDDIRDAARVADHPCYFTAFPAFEWSDQTGANLEQTNHRNVIFANGNVPALPLSSAAYTDPPKLWSGLDDQCTGDCDVVTIPHNTNLSEGVSLKFWDKTADGIRQQKQYQVAAEIYQHKGASECFYDPGSGYSESECAFEQLRLRLKVNLLPESFLRSGLGNGIATGLKHPDIGNVFKLGFVAATDGHNGAPGNVDEATWKGHDGRLDDTPLLRLQDHADWGPGGITGVWAHENTRASIFAAIKRRETYGTSGPRMRVRVLQTEDVNACSDPLHPASILPDAKPMGSTIAPADLGGSEPTFAITAWSDSVPQVLASGSPGVATIAKVQVIKIHARRRRGHRDPRPITDKPVDLPLNGEHFSPTGGCLMWTDTAFDPAEAALYYVRVLQEPTRRWTQHDCAVLLATNPVDYAAAECGTEIPLAPIQERAWTSPIWYEP